MQAGSDTDGGKIALHLDSPTGKLIGTCNVSGTGGWTEWKTFDCDVSGAAGTHTLYLVFEGDDGFLMAARDRIVHQGDDGFLMNVDSFRFTTTLKAGDITGDGKTDTSDLTALLNHLLTKKSLTAEQAAIADLNGDKKLTAADLSLLRRLLLA